MDQRLFLLLILFGSSCQWPQLKVEQFVNVTGRLTCHGQPAANVKISLGERDWPDKDDILEETISDQNGTFALAGKESETFTIQPFIAITHFCPPTPSESHNRCLRTISLNLPETIVSKGHPAIQIKIADIRLEIPRDSEKVDCNSQQFSFVLS